MSKTWKGNGEIIGLQKIKECMKKRGMDKDIEKRNRWKDVMYSLVCPRHAVFVLGLDGSEKNYWSFGCGSEFRMQGWSRYEYGGFALRLCGLFRCIAMVHLDASIVLICV